MPIPPRRLDKITPGAGVLGASDPESAEEEESRRSGGKENSAVQPCSACSLCCSGGGEVGGALVLPNDRSPAFKPYIGRGGFDAHSEAERIQEKLEHEKLHDFLFLQNSEREERYMVGSEHVLLPVGNVIKLLEQKRSSQDCLQFIPYFLAYLIFMWIFFATSETHEQYQVLKTAMASLALADFTAMSDVESTNAWVRDQLPLLGAEVNRSLACEHLDYVAAAPSCKQSYRCDAQLNFVLAIGRAETCEPVYFAPLPDGAPLAGDHVGQSVTLATLVIRSPTAWLAVKYSAQKTEYGLNNRTLPRVTYSGIAQRETRSIPFSIFIIMFVHRM
jgi:hypothetical protein